MSRRLLEMRYILLELKLLFSMQLVTWLPVGRPTLLITLVVTVQHVEYICVFILRSHFLVVMLHYDCVFQTMATFC